MTPQDAARIRDRGEQGDPDALAMSAVLAALGAWEPQNWAVALSRLARAAEAEAPGALEQLRLLAKSQAADADPHSLARRVDLAGWLTSPAKTRLLNEPRVSAVAAFLDQQTCEWLIGRADGRVARAMVFDPEHGGARLETSRSNSAFEFALADLDVVTVVVRARIAAAIGMPAGALEPIQVLHYAPGETFERHFDFLDVSVPGYAADVQRRGQRAATFLVYLNDSFEGGETDFPLIGLRHKGAPGDALMFANVDAAGAPDRRTLHAGLPPTSGEKWLLSQWIRDRAPA